jgi:hypothetical protein
MRWISWRRSFPCEYARTQWQLKEPPAVFKREAPENREALLQLTPTLCSVCSKPPGDTAPVPRWISIVVGTDWPLLVTACSMTRIKVCRRPRQTTFRRPTRAAITSSNLPRGGSMRRRFHNKPISGARTVARMLRKQRTGFGQELSFLVEGTSRRVSAREISLSRQAPLDETHSECYRKPSLLSDGGVRCERRLSAQWRPSRPGRSASHLVAARQLRCPSTTRGGTAHLARC